MIREAKPEDIPNIIAFGRQAFLDTFHGHPKNKHEDVMSYVDESFTTEAFTKEFQDPASTFLLAEIDSKLVGYAKIKQNVYDNGVVGSRPMEVCRIYVAKNQIGKGIGKELMLECLSRAKSNKNDVVWLGVWEFNPTAIDFYKKFGFERCGEHVFQLGSDPQTDWIFQLKLNY